MVFKIFFIQEVMLVDKRRLFKALGKLKCWQMYTHPLLERENKKNERKVFPDQ